MYRRENLNEAGVKLLARQLAAELSEGDIVTLDGQVGAGKTVFARQLIEALYDASEEASYNSTKNNISEKKPSHIPSPTFSLVQHYRTPRYDIAHYDWYRIDNPQDVEPLGFYEDNKNIRIVEWSERAPVTDAQSIFAVRFAIVDDNNRNIEIKAKGRATARLKRFEQLNQVLFVKKLDNANRYPIESDATRRRYYRITDQKKSSLVIMSDESGMPNDYGDNLNSKLAIDNTTIPAFCATARYLDKIGIKIPKIHAVDGVNMFILLEDFGKCRFGKDFFESDNAHQGYKMAVDLLLEMVKKYDAEIMKNAKLIQAKFNEWMKPQQIRCFVHKPKIMDEELLATELKLLLHYYYPYSRNEKISAELEKQFAELWQPHLQSLDGAEKYLVLKDYHSPNLFWLAGQQSIRRIGVIDFQDSSLGHLAYDLVSLLQDARFDVPQKWQQLWLDYYIENIRKILPQFSQEQFLYHYMCIGAQRNSRILGTFVRLWQKERKPQYLRHLRRVWKYTMDCLAHEKLLGLKIWYQEYIKKPA